PNGSQYPLSSEAGNKTMLNVGVDGSIYQINENFHLAGGASVMHFQQDSVTGLRVSPGVDFYGSQTLIAGARVNPTLWSHSDHAIGLSAFVDLTNLVKHLIKKISAPSVKSVEEKKQQTKE
ncbi:MAG: hypothetical protein PHO93_04790, partial [Candidatus Saccharimonadaceae bacterium]|nr:hypothetical protein [Candidatus Saccharimonadaceae bacterium]